MRPPAPQPTTDQPHSPGNASRRMHNAVFLAADCPARVTVPMAALPGRRTRSATTTIDPVPARRDPVLARKRCQLKIQPLLGRLFRYATPISSDERP